MIRATQPRRQALVILTAILLLRLLTLGAYPLTDTTEARYGEIVRKMAELGDWVTPWFDYGVPFWGKPPLAFWLSALSAKLFGVTEFALRLPSFLLGLGMLGLVALMPRHHRGRDNALIAMLALASGALFFVASGAVLTDTALAFTVTLAMAAFWRGVADPATHSTLWRHLLFVALGLGLLAKGPVAMILAGAPIVVWTIAVRRFRASVRALPWRTGPALTLLIALPWYVLAEARTPGFLQYFLVGENFLRFVDPHWAGDLYGSVHTRPKGYIWLLWLGATLPWSLLVPVVLIRLWRNRHDRDKAPATATVGIDARMYRGYLLCFALAPGLLFTLAGSVLWTYLLPAMPALALLVAEWSLTSRAWLVPQRLAWIALILPVTFTAILPYFNARLAKSQSGLLASLPADAVVIYYPKRPFSAQFYSQGRALEADSPVALEALLAGHPDSLVVTPAGLSAAPLQKRRYHPESQMGKSRPMTLWMPGDELAGDPMYDLN